MDQQVKGQTRRQTLADLCEEFRANNKIDPEKFDL